MNAHVRLFLHELEEILREQVKDSFPAYWNEDVITMNILREIGRRLNFVNIKGFKRKMKINWTAFKLSGRIENKFGDIALLVDISYQDGDRIEGVAFLEAKKRNRKQTKFGAIKPVQLKKIYKNAPNSMLLLFDYEDITQFIETGMFLERLDWLVLKPCTCSVVVPINAVLFMRRKDTTLYKFSIPFSYQLFFRYFQGLDLEFRELPIKIAKGYATDKGVPILIIALMKRKRMRYLHGFKKTMLNIKIFEF